MSLFEQPYPEVDIARVPGFRYRGGKFKLRKYICRWCQTSGKCFIDVFGGRGNMTFLMKSFCDYKHWVLNDIQTKPFFESIRNYDGAPLIWPSEKKWRRMHRTGDTSLLFMEPALMWDGGTTETITGKKTTFAAKFKQYNPRLYRRMILRAQKLLRKVQLTSLDACDLMDEYAQFHDSFLYVDPPYLKANVDAYDDKMVDRVRMINILKRAKCKWLFSEYECDDLLEAFGPPLTKIRRVKLIVPGKETVGNRKVRLETECLWSNYPMQPFPISFGYKHAALRQSVRLLEEAGGKVSFKKWQKLVPESWDKELVVSEFFKLSRDPMVYYDGKFLWRIDQ